MVPKSKSNVRVYVRVRPFNKKEETEAAESPSILQVIGNAVRIHCRKKDVESASDFTFDHCFDSSKPGPGAQQLDIYAMVGKEVLANAGDGYNTCLFAYGQTGSGKTYTMMGDIDGPERGIIPRLCSDLFDQILQHQTGVYAARTTQVQASYLEIYCEKVYDLLSKEQSDLQVRQHPEKGPFVEGLSSHQVSSLEQVVTLMHKGAKNRTTCATLMNASSSRSHAIFLLNYIQTFYVGTTQDQKVQTRSKSSRIYLVDLAGSERTKLSGVTGQNLEEAKKINLSLSTLGRVIDLLADRQAGKPCVLPVRESLLTWLLADSLGGNSKTIMLAAVSPAASSYEETMSTLRYAARTKCIVNETFVNETLDLKMVDELRGQIDNLQELLRAHQLSHDGEISSLEGQLQSAVNRTVQLEWELAEAGRAQHRAAEERGEAVAECNRLQAELSKAADATHHLQVLYDASLSRKAELEASLSATKSQLAELHAARQRAANEAAQHRNECEALRRQLSEKMREGQKQLDARGQEIENLKAALRQSSQRIAELEGTLKAQTEQTNRDQQRAAHDQEAALAAIRQRMEKEKAEELKNFHNAAQQARQKLEQELRELRDERLKAQEAYNQLQTRSQANLDSTVSQLQAQHQKELEQVHAEHNQAHTALKRSHESVIANLQQQINERWQQEDEAKQQKQKIEIEEALRSEMATKQQAMEMKMSKMAAHIRDLQFQLRSQQETHAQDVQDLGQTVATLQGLLQRQENACLAIEEQARANAQRLEATRLLAQKEQQAALQRLPAHLEWVMHAKPFGRTPTMAGRRMSDSHQGYDALTSPVTPASGPLLARRRSSEPERTLLSLRIARLESPRTPRECDGISA